MTRCRVIVHPDGSLETNHPVPGVSLDDAWAHLVAGSPAYADLEHFDVDEDDLPPCWQACRTCGGEHPTFDRWRVRDGRVVIDPSLPSLPDVHAHAVMERDREVTRGGRPDALVRLAWAVQHAANGFGLPVRERAAVAADVEHVLAQLREVPA